jgi:hypothetical protein
MHFRSYISTSENINKVSLGDEPQIVIKIGVRPDDLKVQCRFTSTINLTKEIKAVESTDTQNGFTESTNSFTNLYDFTLYDSQDQTKEVFIVGEEIQAKVKIRNL